MPAVVISLQTRLDADINALFAPIEARAKKAGDAIAKALGAGLEKGLQASEKQLGASLHDTIRDAFRDGIRDALKNVKIPASALPRVPSVGAGGGSPYRGGGPSPLIGPVPLTPAQAWRAQQASERIDSRRIARDQAQTARSAARESAATARDEARYAARETRFLATEARTRTRRASAFGGAAASSILRGARAGAGIAADFARGAGLRLSVGEYATANAEADKMAADISNSGYQPGAAGQASVRRGPGAIRATARKAGNASAYSEVEAMQGLDEFTKKTGDLALGEAALERIANLARATGSDLGQMMSAAGDASSALGDNFGSAEEKAKALYQALKVAAGAGKIGSVEMKDFASQYAKVGSSAGQFGGDPARAMAELTGIAEVARQRGGAASSTQAGTSVATFTAQLQTRKHQQAYENLTGKKLYDDHGMLNSANDIIFNTIAAAKGNTSKIQDVGGSAASMRAFKGFQNIYNAAGGGKTGEAAMRAEMDKYSKAVMTDAEVASSLGVAMGTATAQTQLVNNRLQEMTGALQAKVVPQLLAFAPTMTKALEWSTASGGNALATGIGIMVAKSGAEAILATGASALAGALSLAAGPLALVAAGALALGYGIDQLSERYAKLTDSDLRPRDAAGNLITTTPDAMKMRSALEAAGMDPNAADDPRFTNYVDKDGGLRSEYVFGSKAEPYVFGSDNRPEPLLFGQQPERDPFVFGVDKPNVGDQPFGPPTANDTAGAAAYADAVGRAAGEASTDALVKALFGGPGVVKVRIVGGPVVPGEGRTGP